MIGVFLETGEGHTDLQHPLFHEMLVGLQGHSELGAEMPRRRRQRHPPRESHARVTLGVIITPNVRRRAAPRAVGR